MPNYSPNPQGGMVSPNAISYLQEEQPLIKAQTTNALLPQQVAEQQGVGNLEQLAGIFGLSANVSPSSALASATGVPLPAPPTMAPIPGASTAGGYGAGGAWSPSMPGGGSYPASVPAVSMPTDTTAATFARAKDNAVQQLQGTRTSIEQAMGGRGLSGSTAEQAATNAAILGAGSTLADSATKDAVALAQEEEQAAETGFQGAVTQRGQDISALDAARTAGLTARGQDIGATEAANTAAEKQYEDVTGNALSAAQLAAQLQGQKFSQLSALGSLLARVTPSAVPAAGSSY